MSGRNEKRGMQREAPTLLFQDANSLVGMAIAVQIIQAQFLALKRSPGIEDVGSHYRYQERYHCHH